MQGRSEKCPLAGVGPVPRCQKHRGTVIWTRCRDKEGTPQTTRTRTTSRRLKGTTQNFFTAPPHQARHMVDTGRVAPQRRDTAPHLPLARESKASTSATFSCLPGGEERAPGRPGGWAQATLLTSCDPMWMAGWGSRRSQVPGARGGCTCAAVLPAITLTGDGGRRSNQANGRSCHP